MKRIPGLLVVLTACASSGPPTRPPVENVVTISAADGSVEGEVRVTREHYSMQHALPAPRSMVWAALPGSFVDMGLPLPQLDSAAWTAVVRNHLVTRRLGRRRLSTLFDCGHGAAGEYADTYRLYVTVTSELSEMEDGATEVVTHIEAMGQSTSGTAGTVVCASRGTLEGAMADALALRVAKRAAGS